MTESTTISTREELMELLGLNEEGMAQARAEREAYVARGGWRRSVSIKGTRKGFGRSYEHFSAAGA